MVAKGVRVDPLIEAFCVHLESEIRSSQHTVRAYRNDINDLAVFLKENYPNIGLLEVCTQDLYQFLHGLHKLDNGSISRKISALKTFYRYFEREGKISPNPAGMLELPKQEQKLPSFMNIDDVLKLVQGRVDPDDYFTTRNSVILRLFYATGMRISEMEGLSVHDLDLNACLVRVLGKGRKERIIPFGRSSLPFVKTYIEARHR